MSSFQHRHRRLRLQEAIATRPSLHYDFRRVTAAVLNDGVNVGPRLTLTRASAGYVSNEVGNLESVADNLARFDHDPSDVNNAALGILFEGYARTNLLLQSEVTSNASWTATNVTITDDDGVAADGASTADLWTNDSDGAEVTQAVTISAGDQVVVSAFVEDVVAGAHFRIQAGGASGEANAWFDVAGEAIGASTDNTYTVDVHYIEDWGGGIFRCVAVITTATDTALTCLFALADGDSSLTEDSVDAMRVWGLVCEVVGTNQPARATSYIQTTSSPATRAAELCSTTTETEAEQAWTNDRPGVFTIYTDATPLDVATGSNQMFWQLNDESGTNDRPIGFMRLDDLTGNRMDPNIQPLTGNSGGNQNTNAAIVAGTRVQFAIKAQQDDLGFSVNGTTIGGTDTTYDELEPTVDEFHVGHANGGSPWHGRIAEIKAWAFIQSDDFLVDVTS